MASSNHLVTVCICLLCATHSSCSAHDGLIPETEGLTKYQDLRHERFKVNALLAKGYAKSHYLYKTKIPDKIGADESNLRVTYFYKVKDNIYEDDIQAARVNLNDRSGYRKKRPELSAAHFKIITPSNDGKLVGDSTEDGRYVNIISDRNFRGKRRNLSAKPLDSSSSSESNDDKYNVDISQRLQDIQQRVGENPHLNDARINERMLDLKRGESEYGNSNYNNYAWAIKSNRDLEATANIFDIHRRSKIVKENADVKHADKDVLDNMLRNEDEPQFKKTDDLLLSNAAANSLNVGNAPLHNNNQIYFKRRKRDAHLPDGENKNSSDLANGTSVAVANSTEYKINLKNIDVDFYVKKLFMQFGDRESMTMDLAGFDQMLKKLDLDRMVLEPERVQHAPIEAVVNGQRSSSPNVAVSLTFLFYLY